MPYTLPIGPYHPALEEPYKLKLTCRGEQVEGVEIEIGFILRSIELLAQRRNWVQGLVLVEHVCGICSNVHAMCYAMAAEAIAGIQPPPRARAIRVIMAELERLHSHLLWAGIAAEDIGFRTMFMEIYQLRERVMDLLEQISGNRVNYGMIAIGGTTRDIHDPRAILDGVAAVRRGLEKDVVPVFTRNETVKSRTAGIGLLSRANALSYATVGPVARASGVDGDIRKDFPYAAYAELGFQSVEHTAGDVQARIIVRALEMLESVRLIEAALKDLPAGPVRIDDPFPTIPVGEATARVEAPRGEVIYYVASDGSDVPARVKIRTPSFVNIPALEAMIPGQALADVPLIQASVDPCCSCTDR
jgi:Ni,Fe-hydrogenase III large subunit